MINAQNGIQIELYQLHALQNKSLKQLKSFSWLPRIALCTTLFLGMNTDSPEQGPQMKPYQLEIEDVEKQFNTSIESGLSEQEVERRLREYGHNTLPEAPPTHWFITFLHQFQSPLIYILVAAAALIGIVGRDPLDAFIISGVLIFNAIIGTIQERRTQHAIESLKRFIKTSSVVLRDGTKLVIDDSDLVVGDVILLQEGQRIPADARLVTTHGLQIDEAVLTGESIAIHKTSDPISENGSLSDRINMLYRGTYALAGSGVAVVVATGIATEIGKIHRTISSIETEIPLKKEIDRLSYYILLFILGTCLFLFAFGLWIGKSPTELLIMLTALFICVVPEGLPVVLTLVLVSGAYRMAKHNVLVRNLQAVETLGRTDVIITDKTGTLTRNEMMVSHIYANGTLYDVTGRGYYVEGTISHNSTHVNSTNLDDTLAQLATATSLLNNTEITFVPKVGLFDIKGSQTEAALFVLSQKLKVSREQLDDAYTTLYELPFSSEYKYHAGFYEHKGQGIMFLSGAPEILLAFGSKTDKALTQTLEAFLEEGLRVVGIGMKTFDLATIPTVDGEIRRNFFQKLVETNITILGLCGIQDAIRPGMKEVIAETQDAGVRVVMATGDHPKTAYYVAKKIGIYTSGDQVIDGKELNSLSDHQLHERLEKISVYSRVSPQDKLRIVEQFRATGQVVAMTGDGINDAPSLVAADLGIAMGNIGTEVAKQAADLVLLDDSFESITNAIAQGRHIFQTLRRVFLYFFATNTGEIFIIFFALLANLPLPITAAQILWLNLVTDGFLDVALAMEPQEDGLLKNHWSGQKLKLIDRNLVLKTLYMAIPMGLVSLLMFTWYYEADEQYARTITLLTMAMFQWFNAWNCRSEDRSLLEIGLFSNRWLIAATSFVLFLQIVLLYAPFMQRIFKTVPVSLSDWLLVIAVSAPIILIEEVRKYFVRRQTP